MKVFQLLMTYANYLGFISNISFIYIYMYTYITKISFKWKYFNY